jgi:hypothetical protein
MFEPTSLSPELTMSLPELLPHQSVFTYARSMCNTFMKLKSTFGKPVKIKRGDVSLFYFKGGMSIEDGAFIASFFLYEGKFFMHFDYIKKPIEEDFPIADDKQSGWKLHISVDDTREDNINRAWDIVKDILIKYRIAKSKVTVPNIHLTDGEEAGNQFTIYSFTCIKRAWIKIINEIETALSTNNIKPNGFNQVNRQITGSKYVTYRNDKLYDESKLCRMAEKQLHTVGRQEGYLPVSVALLQNPLKPYNPFDVYDPFANVQIGSLMMEEKSSSSATTSGSSSSVYVPSPYPSSSSSSSSSSLPSSSSLSSSSDSASSSSVSSISSSASTSSNSSHQAVSLPPPAPSLSSSIPSASLSSASST